VTPDADFLLEALRAEPTAKQAAMARLAGSVRQLVQELMSRAAPVDDLEGAAILVDEAAALLRAHPQRRPYEGVAEASMAGEHTSFIDFSPFAGPANPVAPPVVLDVVDGQVVGRATFGDAYEGPPGSVHGGFIAGAFDEVLGFTQSLTGRPGMTGLLTVRYRKPTPLDVELRFEGRVDRIEGRKIYTTATLSAGEVVTAEAEGLFISVDPDVFLRLLEQRERDQPG
jgi:acyl-coenzyme A thioesterase PaaI-like protein